MESFESLFQLNQNVGLDKCRHYTTWLRLPVFVPKHARPIYEFGGCRETIMLPPPSSSSQSNKSQWTLTSYGAHLEGLSYIGLGTKKARRSKAHNTRKGEEERSSRGGGEETGKNVTVKEENLLKNPPCWW